MKDMMINFLGAVIFSIIGYLYLIGRAKREVYRMYSS